MRRTERRRQEVACLSRYRRRRASGEIWGDEKVCRRICQEEVCSDVLSFPAAKHTQKNRNIQFNYVWIAKFSCCEFHLKS